MRRPRVRRFTRFADFYPFYLQEHRHPLCRRLHYLGRLLAILLALLALLTRHWQWPVAIPLVGYGCAWVGHFVFEKNRPATFKYPL